MEKDHMSLEARVIYLYNIFRGEDGKNIIKTALMRSAFSREKNVKKNVKMVFSKQIKKLLCLNCTSKLGSACKNLWGLGAGGDRDRTNSSKPKKYMYIFIFYLHVNKVLGTINAT
jgi:hypothetical protein